MANPVAVVVDERTDRVFVVARGPLASAPYPESVGPGSVSVLDAATGRLVRTIGVGVHPLQAALDPTAGRVYVLSEGALSKAGGLGPGSVSVLDAATGRLVRTTGVGVGTATLAVDTRRARAYALSLDPDSVYITSVDLWADNGPSSVSGALSVLDGPTGRLARTLPGVSGAAVAVNARDGRLLVACGVGCPSSRNPSDAGCVRVYDEATGRPLAAHPTSLPVDFRGMVSDDLTGRAFAVLLDDRTANGDSPRAYNHILTLDARTGATLRDAVLTDQEMNTDAFVASASAGRAVLVAVPNGYRFQMGGGTATVSVVDMRSGRVLHSETLNPVEGARGFRTSAVIDARRGRIVVLAQPLADLAGHPSGPAVFNVLDARTGRLLRTAPGQAGDVALGLDAVRGHLFVANARTDTVRMLDVVRL